MNQYDGKAAEVWKWNERKFQLNDLRRWSDKRNSLGCHASFHRRVSHCPRFDDNNWQPCGLSSFLGLSTHAYTVLLFCCQHVVFWFPYGSIGHPNGPSISHDLPNNRYQIWSPLKAWPSWGTGIPHQNVFIRFSFLLLRNVFVFLGNSLLHRGLFVW